MSAERGDVLVAPFSLPTNAGSAAADLQAWPAFAQGQRCGHCCMESPLAAMCSGRDQGTSHVPFCYISLQNCFPFLRFLLAWRRAEPLVVHLLAAT